MGEASVLVRVTCPVCGDLELPLGSVAAVLCAVSGGVGAAFSCTMCSELHVRQVPLEGLGDLLEAGAAVWVGSGDPDAADGLGLRGAERLELAATLRTGC